MTISHRRSSTRRELLLASGTLFAWAYTPKLALAEGRDPRLLDDRAARRARRTGRGRAGRRSELGQRCAATRR